MPLRACAVRVRLSRIRCFDSTSRGATRWPVDPHARAKHAASSDPQPPLASNDLRVGETGFEPATARPPAGCATRLRHSPWPSPILRASVRQGSVPSGWEHTFVQKGVRTCGSCGQSKPVSDFAWRRKARGQRDNYFPAGPRTNASTTPPTASATSPTRSAASEPSPRSAPRSSWRCFAANRASTAARAIRWCSSSTISATRASTSPKASAITAGSRSSTRSASARSFVQTVIGDEPPCGAGSRVRW
jgi:hypothetical protein